MQNNIQILAPEPITVLPSYEGEAISNMGPAVSPRKHRTNSSVNDNFNFARACVTDCTIVTGDNNVKFAMWKITIFLQPSDTLVANDTKPKVASPQIQIYKRYSDFVSFRSIIVNKIKSREQTTKVQLLLPKIPTLPGGVPWYKAWKYQKVNLNKKWLIERRIVLEMFLNGIILNRDIVEICHKEILTFLEHQSTATSS